MELVEVDALETEAAEAHFDALMKVGCAAAGGGFGWALAGDASLGGDDEVGCVGVEGFGDDVFRDEWAVGVGGVDEVDAEGDGSAEYVAHLFAVGGFSPCAFVDQTHGSEAEPVDGEVAAEEEVGHGRFRCESGHFAHECKCSG